MSVAKDDRNNATEHISPPAMQTTRQPKRSEREPASGPAKKTRAKAMEPIQAVEWRWNTPQIVSIACFFFFLLLQSRECFWSFLRIAERSIFLIKSSQHLGRRAEGAQAFSLYTRNASYCQYLRMSEWSSDDGIMIMVSDSSLDSEDDYRSG